MASKQLLIVAAILAVFAAVPAPALAAGPVFGDCRGRGINVIGKPEGTCPLVTSLNSSTYPTGAGFRVSLALSPAVSVCDPAFKYSAVMETAAGVIAACSAADSIVVWASGDGRVAGLNMSGQWWFTSGDQIHLGMKFNVTVLSADVKIASSSSPPPVRAQGGGVAFAVLATGVVAAAALIHSKFGCLGL
ncbi:unnamed protein product [Urochloa humidicola]